MNKCTQEHDYKPIASPQTNKNGDLVQVVYCVKCADSKEILIKGK